MINQYHGTLLSNKKEYKIGTYNKLHESSENYTEWKSKFPRDYGLYYFIYKIFLEC